MRKAVPNKDVLIKQTLKKEDYIELPMDDSFYEKMHEQIMQAVDKTEIKSAPKWSKARVFLEPKSQPYRTNYKKVVKLGIAGLVTSVAIGFIGLNRVLTQFL